jgi:hypothetical protein
MLVAAYFLTILVDRPPAKITVSKYVAACAVIAVPNAIPITSPEAKRNIDPFPSFVDSGLLCRCNWNPAPQAVRIEPKEPNEITDSRGALV